ncbi:hypothetical protein FHW20_000105 [Ochrobactrum intermedium]|uniref:Uncharacterized protein n=1 Tax=Brucella intermedia TaxID=94625 RepID=A0ABR6AIU8_9HYPH|nr:hypothetical protein [Brucella intermedia]
MSRSQKTTPASGDMLQLFPNIPGNRFLPPVLYKQPNKKAARIIPAACFLNANAQTPAWPLLAGPPPTVDDDIARNVHGATVSVQSVSLQPENSGAQSGPQSAVQLAADRAFGTFRNHHKEIRTVWGCPDFLRTGDERDGRKATIPPIRPPLTPCQNFQVQYDFQYAHLSLSQAAIIMQPVIVICTYAYI